ncbi:MAG: hypothetical protein WBA93_27175 [Microcoleaceae cyanobacterium]
MLRQNSVNIEPDISGQNAEGEPTSASPGVDIQRELNRLEEIILDSTRIPIVGLTLIDEEKLLDRLDIVRLNLPVAFQAAEMMVRCRDEILLGEFMPWLSWS